MDNALTGGGAAIAYSPKHQTRQTNDLFCTPGLDGLPFKVTKIEKTN